MKDDCISRTAAVDMVKRCFQPEHRNKEVAVQMCLDGLRGLPSAQSERKVGHWIMDDIGEHGSCSLCGHYEDLVDGRSSYKYCSSCGADMRGMHDFLRRAKTDDTK